MMSIAELSRRLRAGELTSSELTQRCLNVIDKLEPQIHAWVCVDRDRALASAKQLDAELAQGKSRGPLHGIPIGVKDIVDVAGLPTRAGSPLTSDKPVAKDAAIVTRLRDAGAVILGKTVTTEYASFDPPPTRNPWNLKHTPGGSSSGSAAAVAAGMCLATIGTQTGGSIIRPASYCGVYGFKP
jgi:aspartyl-tRNA(Asn)/glutamyl-tRNA(Gln) amidotransferase subunit A